MFLFLNGFFFIADTSWSVSIRPLLLFVVKLSFTSYLTIISTLTIINHCFMCQHTSQCLCQGECLDQDCQEWKVIWLDRTLGWDSLSVIISMSTDQVSEHHYLKMTAKVVSNHKFSSERWSEASK